MANRTKKQNNHKTTEQNNAPFHKTRRGLREAHIFKYAYNNQYAVIYIKA